MFKLKDERQSLTGVIADSFRLLNKTWAINIIVVLIGIVISLIILFLFSWGIIADVMHQVMRLKGHHGAMSPTDLPFLKPVFSGPMILFYCGLFIAAWISKITVAILVRTSWNIATKNEAKLKNAFAVGLKYFYVYFCLLLILLAVYVAVYFVQWLFSLIHLYWLDVIIAILTQLVIYYVAIKLFLVEASAVIDECGIRGIGRSWRVVQGSWWRTVGFLFYLLLFSRDLFSGNRHFLCRICAGILTYFK
jgi:hypothetical protein